MSRRLLVIGGGAAGLMAGIFAASAGTPTVIVERNAKVGRKLYITGKGRCNLTNQCDARTVIANTPTNGKFLYSALSEFPPDKVMEFFEQNGLSLKVERGNRVFPVSDRAADVVDTLHRMALRTGCELVQDRVTELVLENGSVCGVQTEKGGKMDCTAVVIATGGASYPLTGSTGDGYTLAQQAGHTIMPLRPSLIPLETQEHFGYDADGLLLKNIGIQLVDTKKNKTIYTDFGEMELKRWGVSGAVVRSASAHIRQMERGRYQLQIDLKPALSEEKLEARLLRELTAAKGRAYREMLLTLMPSALTEDFVKWSGIPGEKHCSEISREERHRILSLLKGMTVTVTGFRPLSEAIVTSGGVCVKEIDPKTMGSKLVKGLYFAGEVMDYDCYTGGFNLQCAFATGRQAGLKAGIGLDN